MPGHYGSEKMSAHNNPDKKPAKKGKSGMRKMSEKEKKLVKEHFEKHQPNASRADKARVRMALMRGGVDVKTMKGLHKLVGFSM
jgi:hypothetical protein